MNEKRLTSYCGLYCLDCIPSKQTLFESLRIFEEHLSKLDFEKYAQVKANRNPAFKKYSDFMEVLSAIEALECKTPCRENGGYSDCKIRSCVVSKGYEGCWECSDFKTCELLLPLKKVHVLLDDNLELIKNEGVENWVCKRGKHYSWSKP